LGDLLWEFEQQELSSSKLNMMYKLEFRKKIWLDPSIDEMNTHVEYLVYAQVLFIFDFFLKIFQKKTSFK